MAPKQPSSKSGLNVKLPASLTLKDLVTIVSVAVSLTLAWGVFSTRITVLEREVLALRTTLGERGAVIEKLEQQVRSLENHQQDQESLIDQAFITMKRPIPPRHARD